MTGEVSSERSVDIVVERAAKELVSLKEKGGKVVAVAGPVVVNTGGAEALGALIREGYVHALLSGNAIAVHDIEYQFFGTSLGVELKSGEPTREGHKNHMRAINRINRYGSIEAAVEAGELNGGIMYEVIKKEIPYCLA